MDPLSIATAAGSTIKVLYTVSEKTLNFVKDAKVIDQTLSVIRSDLSSLIVVLETIRSTLRKPQQLVLAQAAANNVFPSIIKAAIQECHDTAESIHDILKGIEEGNSSKSLVARSMRQVRFLNRKDDLRKVQSRLKAQKANLQLLLQMLNVFVGLSDSMYHRTNFMNSSIAQYPATVFRENIGPQINLLETLVRKALITDGAPQDRLNAAAQVKKSVQIDDPTNRVESNTGSPQVDEDDSQDSDYKPLPHEAPFIDGRSFEDTTAQEIPMPDLDDRPDSDDELELEHTLGTFKKGQHLYEKTYYIDAEKVLRSCLKTAAGIRSGGIDIGTIQAIQLKLALSCFYQEKWDDAGEILHHLTTIEATTADDFALRSNALLALGRVYLARADYDSATLASREARAAYKRLHGKTDANYIESSRLLILVYTLSGDYVAAEIYNKVLPTQSRLQTEELNPAIDFLERMGYKIRGQPQAHVWLGDRYSMLRYLSLQGLLNSTSMELLCLIGIDVNNRFTDGKEHPTALMEAASKGRVRTIKFLLQAGADVEICDSQGRTALTLAMQNEHLQSQLLLLGVDVNELAASLRDENYTKWKQFYSIIDSEKKEERSRELEFWVADDTHHVINRALGLAVSKGQLTTVERLLVCAEADPNFEAARTQMGNTVLMDAVLREFVEITRLLLQKGADISRRNLRDCTALDFAKRAGNDSEKNRQIISLLENHEADASD